MARVLVNKKRANKYLQKARTSALPMSSKAMVGSPFAHPMYHPFPVAPKRRRRRVAGVPQQSYMQGLDAVPNPDGHYDGDEIDVNPNPGTVWPYKGKKKKDPNIDYPDIGNTGWDVSYIDVGGQTKPIGGAGINAPAGGGLLGKIFPKKNQSL